MTSEFGTPIGETTADRRLTIGAARCLGSCGLAPVVVLDGQVHGHMTPESTVSAMRSALEANAPAEVS